MLFRSMNGKAKLLDGKGNLVGTSNQTKGNLFYLDLSNSSCFLTHAKESWIEVMNEEIGKIERNDTWTLVPRPKDKNVIGTKWVFRNKLNEDGKVSRNKARLVCKGYS